MTKSDNPIRVDIWHNILWSQYKGEVFSSLHKMNDAKEFDIRFFQIAETDGNRSVLSGIDLSHHRYPFKLLFKGSYDQVGFFRRLFVIMLHTLKSDADLSILTGYEKIECWAQLILLKLKRKKVAIFCDSTIYDQPQTFAKGILKRIIFKSVDGIFGYGERSRDYVLHYGAKSEQWHHRCQAAALPNDYSAEKALSGRLKYATGISRPRYLYVGRLSPEKNLERLLQAFATVKQKFPEASLVCVGNGAQRGELYNIARKLLLDPATIFVGSKSGAELFAEYSKATCFVLPSTSEPWGLVVNEALHYGCPVIVSERCGCVPELVIDGVTGFSHKAEDVDDLAAKMSAASQTFSDIEKTARACFELMANYTPDTAATQILNGCRIILFQKI